MKLTPLLCILFCALYITSCTNKNDVDTSKVKINFKSVRYDKEFYAIDTNAIQAGTFALMKKYPDFTSLFTEQLQGWGTPSDTNTTLWKGMKTFLTHKDYRDLYDTIQKKYTNTNVVDEELIDLLKQYKYYFPNAKVPTVYYFSSGLSNWGCVTLDDTIVGVGLDMYLGEDFPHYAAVQIPQYKFHQLTKNNIAPDVARNLYRSAYTFIPDGKKLLEMIIEKGKEQFFIDKMLPNINEEYKMGFTKTQMDWCRKNEYLIYSYFVSNKLLYSSDLQQVFRYVNDGPNTTGMPAESPGNIGSWLGLQIVRAFVKNNNFNLTDLLNNKLSAEQFLQKSNYKP